VGSTYWQQGRERATTGRISRKWLHMKRRRDAGTNTKKKLWGDHSLRYELPTARIEVRGEGILRHKKVLQVRGRNLKNKCRSMGDQS